MRSERTAWTAHPNRQDPLGRKYAGPVGCLHPYRHACTGPALLPSLGRGQRAHSFAHSRRDRADLNRAGEGPEGFSAGASYPGWMVDHLMIIGEAVAGSPLHLSFV